jgi:hypothetical protein
MALDNPRPGHNSAAEYMLSAIPWVTSSTVNGVQRYDFPQVTKSLVLKHNGGANIKVAFTRAGLTTNYFEMSPGEAYADDLRVTRLFVSGSSSSVSVIAGLTTIDSRGILILTASNGIEGVG